MLFGFIGILAEEFKVLLFSLLLFVMLFGEKGLLFTPGVILLVLFSSVKLGLLLLERVVGSLPNELIDYCEVLGEGNPIYSACSMFLSSYKSSISVFLWLFKILS